MMTLSDKYREIRERLKNSLSEARYAHSLGVSVTAACMAMRYDISLVEKAYLAGLVHDAAKCLTDEEKLSLAEEKGLPVNEYEKSSPGLLHAPLGAVLAEEKYGITDEEILSAVRLHTLGRPGMTTLEAILYVADYIEPDRPDVPYFRAIREAAFRDLDEACLLTAETAVGYTRSKGQKVDPRSLETLEYYRNRMEEKGLS